MELYRSWSIPGQPAVSNAKLVCVDGDEVLVNVGCTELEEI